MNNFDKQRIENAIWILQMYYLQIDEIAKNKGYHNFDIDRIFDFLNEIKEEFNHQNY